MWRGIRGIKTSGTKVDDQFDPERLSACLFNTQGEVDSREAFVAVSGRVSHEVSLQQTDLTEDSLLKHLLTRDSQSTPPELKE